MSKMVEVKTLLALSIDGGLSPKGSVIRMSEADADAMEASGRGKRVPVADAEPVKVEKATASKP